MGPVRCTKSQKEGLALLFFLEAAFFSDAAFLFGGEFSETARFDGGGFTSVCGLFPFPNASDNDRDEFVKRSIDGGRDSNLALSGEGPLKMEASLGSHKSAGDEKRRIRDAPL